MQDGKLKDNQKPWKNRTELYDFEIGRDCLNMVQILKTKEC